MKMTKKLIAIAILILASVSVSRADSPQATVEALTSENLLAVAYVDLNSIDTEACLKWAEQQKLVDSDVVSEMSHLTGMAQEFLRQATKAGADHVIALVRQEDLKGQGSPLFVISIADGHEAKKTIRSLRQILGLLQIPNFELEVWNNSILGGSADQIERAKANPSVDRPNFAKAWQKFAGHDAGAMIFGNRDTRRVVRELLPTLDRPFENITGKMIADKLVCGGVSIDLPGEVGAKFVIQTSDGGSAEAVRDAAVNLKKILTSSEGEYSAVVPPRGIAAISAVEPVVAGNDVVLDLEPLLSDEVMLASLLEPLQAGSRQTQRMNNARQVILAMHNHESANQSFPAHATFDADGKPLLSWRVQLLPFLEEVELYKQFKLDEPWDSPHNIKLVEKMPEVFADPSRVLNHLKRSGLTRVVVPFADRTMFHGAEGATFQTITDGSSNTIAIVNVIPKQAVVWTQPTDWNVNLESPKDGLFDDDNTETVIARADGSAELLSWDIPAERLKGLLTKDGGEVP